MATPHPCDKPDHAQAVEHIEYSHHQAESSASAGLRSDTPPPKYSLPDTKSLAFPRPGNKASRRPKPLTSSPASFLHQSKKAALHEPAPEPDHAEWEAQCGIKDTVQIRDRYAFPVDIHRTQLSPTVSECDDMPTRPPSFRSSSSISRADEFDEAQDLSSADSKDSIKRTPEVGTEYGNSMIDGMKRHIKRMEMARDQTRSTPSLRSLVTSSQPKSILVKRTVDSRGSASHQVEGPSVTSSPPRTLRHSKARSAREAREAEERFAKRLGQKMLYKQRCAMLKRKDELRNRLRTVQTRAEEVAVLRDLGRLYLTHSTITVEENGIPQTVIMRRTAEIAASWLSNCVSASHWSDAQACYLLGRAHEVLSKNVSQEDTLKHRNFALIAYQRALQADPEKNVAAQTLCSLGVLYFTMQDYDNARHALEKSITVNPKQPQALLNYGQLWDGHYRENGTEQEKANAVEQIRHSFTRVLRLDPTNEYAAQRLQSLGGAVNLDDEDTASRRSGSFSSGTLQESLPFEDEGTTSVTMPSEEENKAVSEDNTSSTDGSPAAPTAQHPKVAVEDTAAVLENVVEMPAEGIACHSRSIQTDPWSTIDVPTSDPRMISLLEKLVQTTSEIRDVQREILQSLSTDSRRLQEAVTQVGTAFTSGFAEMNESMQEFVQLASRESRRNVSISAQADEDQEEAQRSSNQPSHDNRNSTTHPSHAGPPCYATATHRNTISIGDAVVNMNANSPPFEDALELARDFSRLDARSRSML